MEEFTVTFKSHDVSVRVKRGTDLLSAALKSGIILNSTCGGEGLCGKCRVIVNKGKIKKEPSKLLTEEEEKKGYVLACETLIEGDVEIVIPAESVEIIEKDIRIHEGVDEFSKGAVLERESAYKHSPLVRKFYLELPKPSADYNISDLDSVTKELEAKAGGVFMSARLGSIRHLGDVIRENDFKITVTVTDKDGSRDIAAVEPGDTSAKNFGLAFDIGTTTVAGQLIDLNTKSILGSRMAYNKQARYGSDIITRIIYGSEAEGLGKLNEAVVENLNEIAEDIAKSSGISLSDVNAAVCAGNTTMAHLLLKIDPAQIRRKPYIPTATVFPTLPAGEVGLKVNPKCAVYCLPGVSSYIGGDIVSGVLACGLFEEEDLALLMDIGTNGEVVLGNKEWMMGCAASAGPAFEGSGLTCGMKAVKGAIQKVVIDDKAEARFETIGGDKPKGICGSGYIDLLNQMFRHKIMTKDGKINASLKSSRIRKVENGHEYVVAFAADTQTGKDIAIHSDDIENLKRAKGALYSAVITLLNKVGKTLSELKRIYIAGGFGNYLDIDGAIAIGLLPDIERSIYQFIGNSSLAGARMSLLSEEAYSKVFDIHKNITYLDLGSEPAYMDEYVAALFFPHTDLGRFPSVR